MYGYGDIFEILLAVATSVGVIYGIHRIVYGPPPEPLEPKE